MLSLNTAAREYFIRQHKAMLDVKAVSLETPFSAFLKPESRLHCTTALFDTEIFKLNPFPAEFPVFTRGEGDTCAFHAVLGEFNPVERMFICADVQACREYAGNAIKAAAENKTPDNKSTALIARCINSIKDSIIDGRQIGSQTARLLEKYQLFKLSFNEKSNAGWRTFAAALKKCPEIMQYIEANGCQAATLKLKFYNALPVNQGKLYFCSKSN